MVRREQDPKPQGHTAAATIVAALALTACAMATSVSQVGPDTYAISGAAAPARGGTAGAQSEALAAANAHCASLGRQILVTNINARTVNAFGAGTSNVVFRCLPEGDPELARPTYDPLPSAVIEDRRTR